MILCVVNIKIDCYFVNFLEKLSLSVYSRKDVSSTGFGDIFEELNLSLRVIFLKLIVC